MPFPGDVHSLEAAYPDARDAVATRRLAEKLDAAWIACDGYGFGRPFVEQLRGQGARVLQIDDLRRAEEYAADLLIHPTPGSELDPPACAPWTTGLLGVQHVLVSRSFVAARLRYQAATGRRVVVLSGGSDPAGLAPRSARVLRRSSIDARFDVVVGSASPHLEAVMGEVDGDERFTVVLDPPKVADLLLSADLAIAAGGGTTWELCCVGVPALLVSAADNQRPAVQFVARQGAGIDLGTVEALSDELLRESVRLLLEDPAELRQLSDRARGLIDGRGADRAVEAMLAPAQAHRS